jgi:hypothetical protein
MRHALRFMPHGRTENGGEEKYAEINYKMDKEEKRS